MGAEASTPQVHSSPQDDQRGSSKRQFLQSKSLDFSLGESGLSTPKYGLGLGEKIFHNSHSSYNLGSGTDQVSGVSSDSKCNRHFTDFCLYPDRFSMDLTQHGPRSLESATQDVIGRNPDSLGALGNSPNISKYSFRMRTRSNEQPNDCEVPARRQRSNSLSSSYYYFDFSFIPEKDPRCLKEEACRKRIRNASQGDDEDGQDIFVNANKKVTLENPNQKAVERKKSSPPQFSFFDYSMIPDKMDQQHYTRAVTTTTKKI